MSTNNKLEEAMELLQSCLPVIEAAVSAAKELGDGDDVSYLVELTSKLDAFLKNDSEETPANLGRVTQGGISSENLSTAHGSESGFMSGCAGSNPAASTNSEETPGNQRVVRDDDRKDVPACTGLSTGTGGANPPVAATPLLAPGIGILHAEAGVCGDTGGFNRDVHPQGADLRPKRGLVHHVFLRQASHPSPKRNAYRRETMSDKYHDLAADLFGDANCDDAYHRPNEVIAEMAEKLRSSFPPEGWISLEKSKPAPTQNHELMQVIRHEYAEAHTITTFLPSHWRKL